MRWKRKEEVEYQEQFAECITSDAELEELYEKHNVKDIPYTPEEVKKFTFKDWRPGRKFVYAMLLYAMPKITFLGDNGFVGILMDWGLTDAYEIGTIAAILDTAWLGLAIYAEILAFKWKRKRKQEKAEAYNNPKQGDIRINLSEPDKPTKHYGSDVPFRDLMLEKAIPSEDKLVETLKKATPKKATVKVYHKRKR